MPSLLETKISTGKIVSSGASSFAMKLAQILGLLLLPLTAMASDTAYQALRAVGVEKDKALLNRVIEVKGESGVPQPERWIVVLDDPLARGGVRELEIANGRIVSERTPVRKYSGVSTDAAMNFERLNLDSKGAFTVAEQEAKLAKISFDAVDYVLRKDDERGTPVWDLQLLDPDLRLVGSVRIAADTGAVLSRRFPVAGRSEDRVDDDDDMEDVVEKGKRHGKNIGHRIDRTFHRVGASLEEFFTGKRTLDRRFRDEE